METQTQDKPLLTLKFLVYGVASSRLQAGRIKDHLENAGLRHDCISVVGHHTVLLDMGVSRKEARRYQRRVKEGEAVISVLTEQEEEAKAATKIFQALGAFNVTMTRPGPD